MVSYQSHNFVPSTLPAHKNVIDQVPNLLPGEQLRATKAHSPTSSTQPFYNNSNASTVALRSEQKPIALIMELLHRFSQPGDIVMDFFGGTFSTAAACLRSNRRFIGCEKDPRCFEYARAQTIHTFAALVAQGSSDFRLSPEATARAHALHERAQTTLPDDPRWSAPPNLPQYQCLPKALVTYLSALHCDRRIFVKYANTSVGNWPRNYQALLNNTPPLQLLAADCVSTNLTLGPSSIKHPRVGLGVFAAEHFPPGYVLCQYFGTLVYHDLSTRRSLRKTYGQGIQGVTYNRFKQYAVEVEVKDKNEFRTLPVSNPQGNKLVYIVPPTFSIASYINDPIYDPEDEEYENYNKGTLETTRKPNAKLVDNSAAVVDDVEQLEKPYLVTVVSTTEIQPGQEIFMLYNRDEPVYDPRKDENLLRYHPHLFKVPASNSSGNNSDDTPTDSA